MAEAVGFEPTELSLDGFQDRCLRPLGHTSRRGGNIIKGARRGKCCIQPLQLAASTGSIS